MKTKLTKTQAIANLAIRAYNQHQFSGCLTGRGHVARVVFNAKYAWLSGAIKSTLPEEAEGKVYAYLCPHKGAGRRLVWNPEFLSEFLDVSQTTHVV